MDDSQIENSLPSFNDINPNVVVNTSVTNRLSPNSDGERNHLDDIQNNGAPTFQINLQLCKFLSSRSMAIKSYERRD